MTPTPTTMPEADGWKLADRLEDTLTLMATTCSVDMYLWDKHCGAVQEALAILRRPALAAPMTEADGWKLVPLEPTPEMYQALMKWPAVWPEQYTRMLAAAPPPDMVTPQPWKERENFTFDLDEEMTQRLDALAERCEKQGLGTLASANYHGQGLVQVPSKWLRQIIAGYRLAAAQPAPAEDHTAADYYSRGYGLRCMVVDYLNGAIDKEGLRSRFSDWEYRCSGTKFIASPAELAKWAGVEPPTFGSSPAPAPDDLRKAAEAMAADYQTSENHHPDHVLVPRDAFDALRRALNATAPAPAPDDLRELREAADNIAVIPDEVFSEAETIAALVASMPDRHRPYPIASAILAEREHSSARIARLESENARLRRSSGEILATIIQLRDKHSSPTGDAYTCGLWDQSQRIFGKVEEIARAAVSEPKP